MRSPTTALQTFTNSPHTRTLLLCSLPLALITLAWLPGQTAANAVRLWFFTGALPWLLLLFLPAFSPSSSHPQETPIPNPIPLPGPTPLHLCLLAAALVPVFIAPFQTNPYSAISTALLPLGVLAFFYLGESRALRATHAQTLAAITGTGIALLSFGSATATFGNPNFLAHLLVCTALWTSALLMPPSNPAAPSLQSRWTVHNAWKRILVCTLCLLVQLGAIVHTQSLGAVFALGAGWLALAFLYLWQHPRQTARHRPAVLGLALVLTLCFLRLFTVALEDSAVLQEHFAGRFYLWRISASILVDTFPFGAGPGQFHAHFLAAQTHWLSLHTEDLHAWTNAHHAHNEFLHALASQGLAGLLLLTPFGAALLRPQLSPAWATVVAFWVLSLVSLPLYEPAVAAWAAFAAGSCSARLSAHPKPQPWRLIWIGITTAALCVSTAHWLGDRLLYRGTQTQDQTLLAASHYLSLQPQRALQHRASLLLAQQQPHRAQTLIDRAAKLEPSAACYLLQGRIAMANRDYPRAIDAFRAAVAVHPRLFAGHFNLARAYEDAGDRFSARRHAKRARSLRPSDKRLKNLPK